MTEQSVQEFEQQHLDHVIDEIKQAKEKAEEKIHTARHDIKGSVFLKGAGKESDVTAWNKRPAREGLPRRRV